VSFALSVFNEGGILTKETQIAALCNGTVSIETRINNNLETFIDILTLSGTASQNGIEYASFDYTFKNDFTTNAGENPGPYSEIIYPVIL
jgi:hypothetical protein